MEIFEEKKYTIKSQGLAQELDQVEILEIEEDFSIGDVYRLKYKLIREHYAARLSALIFAEEVRTPIFKRDSSGRARLVGLDLHSPNCDQITFVDLRCNHVWADTGFAFTFCIKCDKGGRRVQGLIVED